MPFIEIYESKSRGGGLVFKGFVEAIPREDESVQIVDKGIQSVERVVHIIGRGIIEIELR